MITETEPRTAAGRLLLASMPTEWHPINRDIVAEHILAIEAETALLDVERLAGAIQRRHNGAAVSVYEGLTCFESPLEVAEIIAAEYALLGEPGT